jgi:hypothetical protein
MITRVRQQNPNGTVRSTASGARLRAWPTPAVCLPSKIATSIDQRAAYRAMQAVDQPVLLVTADPDRHRLAGHPKPGRYLGHRHLMSHDLDHGLVSLLCHAALQHVIHRLPLANYSEVSSGGRCQSSAGTV